MVIHLTFSDEPTSSDGKTVVQIDLFWHVVDKSKAKKNNKKDKINKYVCVFSFSHSTDIQWTNVGKMSVRLMYVGVDCITFAQHWPAVVR